MAFLKRINSDDATITELVEEFTTIGRSERADMCIPHQNEISREHCSIRVHKDGLVTIADLGSRNGTLVNGERIHGETRLREGDVIRLSTKVDLRYSAEYPDADDEITISPEEMTIADLPIRDVKVPKHSRTAPPRKHTSEELGQAADEVEKELENAGFKDLMAKFAKQAKHRPKPKPKTTDSDDEDVW